MAAAIMRNDPEALSQKEHHLVIPVVCAERPTVVKHTRLRVVETPILVENLGPIFSLEVSHGDPSFVKGCRPAGPALRSSLGRWRADYPVRRTAPPVARRMLL